MPDPEEQPHQVAVHLDRVLLAADMSVAELSRRTGVTVVNLSILKNNRAKAIRFSTLTAICQALDCQPGDILEVTQGSGKPEELGRTC